MEHERKGLHGAAEDVGTVVFNVGGRQYEVLRQTIEVRPATLLASLLEDIGTDIARPIFVDANPERFAHILDWYRYGEMYVAEKCPVGGVLHDARFFLLPDFVTINGTSYSIRPGVSNAAYEAGVTAVKKHWPSFEQCMDSLFAEIQAGLERIGVNAAWDQEPLAEDGRWTAGEIAEDRFLVKSILLYDGFLYDFRDDDPGDEYRDITGWERQGVCSLARCRVLQSELTKRGYDCEISDKSDDPHLCDYIYGPALFLNVFWHCADGLGGRRRAWRAALEDVDAL